MAAYSSGWSGLLPEILVLIFSRLELVDFIRAAAACRSWRRLKSDFRVRPKNQIPWLMLSSPSPLRTRFRYFHSLLPSSDPHEIRLPEFAGLFCIGSSQGFLIYHDQATADLRAVNPVSGAHIPLPPTTNIPDIDFGKAILSPDPGFGGGPRTAVVIYSFGRLAFAQPGDGKWTLLDDSPLPFVCDILFHKNRLHAVDFCGTLASFDLSNPSDPCSLLCNWHPREVTHTKSYLAESPDGQDLYCVVRLIQLFNPDGDSVDEDEDEDEDDDDIHRTMHFWVYKLDELERQWIEVDTLGDISLFLGCNHSSALSATEHPSIKRNSIYFTNDFREGYVDRTEIARDMGVFDLGDGSIQPLSLNDDLRCLPPMWFTPALS